MRSSTRCARRDDAEGVRCGGRAIGARLEGPMADLNTRDVVERYGRAMESRDIDSVLALLHPDYVEDYPQSGERIRGAANLSAMMQHYPGGEPRTSKVEQLIGAEDSWVMSPSYIPMRVEGSGDQYTAIAHIIYPDGSEWHLIQLIRLKDGKIHRIVSYYAAPFEAPEWRAPFVERIPTEG
jgi:SnoaL-like domain